MKLRRLIQLTASVATAAVLSACGGGGDAGPQWAQGTKQALTSTASNIRMYATPCEPYYTFYSIQGVVVMYQTSDGDFEEVHNNYFSGTECDAARLALVKKTPASKVTTVSTFVDPDLGLSTARQSKTTKGGELVVVKYGVGVTVERLIDQFGAFYEVVIPPTPGNTGLIDALPTPVSEDTQFDLAAYQGNTLYWGDRTALDNDGYPTNLQQEPQAVFTLVPNTPANAPAGP